MHISTFDAEKELQTVGILGYTQNIIEKIELFDKYNLQYRIEFIIGQYNNEEIENSIVKKLINNKKLHVKYLLPINKYSILNEKEIVLKMGNHLVFLENYEKIENTNLCFRKGPFVDVDGEIYPCIGLASEKFKWGNIKDGLYNVYRNDKHREYWNMSNSKDPVCQDCAERLMCINCKAYKILYNNETLICRSKV